MVYEIGSSITSQQTKLDLELVPKENQLDIRKFNERILHGLTPREPSFQVVLDALALTRSYSAFLITTDVPEMDQPWRTFAAIINRSFSGKTSGLDKLRISRAQILWGMYYQKNVDYVELLWEDFIYQIENRTLSWRNKIGMHTYKNDYLINTLRFVFAKESTQIYGKLLLATWTSPEMKESKAYKTYLGYATCAVPLKIARKFKKASPSKKDRDLVPKDEEPVKKGKRVKRPTNKSTTTSAAGTIIKETPVETKYKRKEKMDVDYGKGIELLSEVALDEKAQMKEVRKKSLRDFHRTHPSGSSIVVEKPPSVEKIKPTVTSKGTVSESNEEENESDDDETQSDNEKGLGFEQDTNEKELGSESDQHEKEEENDDETKRDEEKGMDARLSKPTQTDKEGVQDKEIDAEMIDAQQGNENKEITQEQEIKESLNVTLDETHPPSKTSPLVDDDLDEEEAIRTTEKKNLENVVKDETLKIDKIVNIKESRNHPLENVIGNLNQRTLRSQAQNQNNFFCLISTIEPKNVNEALTDKSWIVAMQEELNQFISNDLWELVPQPRNMPIIRTKWVFRNKLDENGVVSRNKARLVSQGYNQKDDYDETNAPVARLESIRILLVYACALDFKLFQMDVKSAFLNGFINEEVYLAQPSGFIDFKKPDHVYNLKKALYGLKQTSKAGPDIMFSVCICARFQVAPKTAHVEAVKRIF
nr:retrovirus-related Pol polyprotein from transposon TNT 1-94 [Tanacetum cinerariifolium]